MCRCDEVCSCPVLGQIQTIVPCLTECFICNCLVPVFIYGTISKMLVIVEMELVRVLSGKFFRKLIMELVVFIIVDGSQVCFGQIDVIQFACFIQLITNGQIFYDLDGNGFKTTAFGIPVQRVLGQSLGVVLDVLGQSVSTIVPQAFDTGGQNVFNTNFFDEFC